MTEILHRPSLERQLGWWEKMKLEFADIQIRTVFIQQIIYQSFQVSRLDSPPAAINVYLFINFQIKMLYILTFSLNKNKMLWVCQQ